MRQMRSISWRANARARSGSAPVWVTDTGRSITLLCHGGRQGLGALERPEGTRKPPATYRRFCYLVRPVFVDRSDTAGKSHTLVRVYADGEAESRTAAAGKAMHTTLASAATFVAPEQTEEPRALLQQRLALLCKTLGQLSLGFFVFERAVSAIVFGNTAVQRLFLTRPAVFHAAATLLFGLVWLACRSRRLPLGALTALDAAMPV